MKKKIYIVMLLAAFSLMAVNAQDNTNLNKEITLEKDIAPIKKTVTKKNELPKVKKTTKPTQKTSLGYSDLTTPIEVPTTIPTLLPYGYRTAHNFSDKRGYLDIGGGSQANFGVDFGYRVIDEEQEKLGVWINHLSTWEGKNSSKIITLDENRIKQKFNDNTIAVDYSKMMGSGTLSFGAKAHIDIFNYYGGWNTDPNTYAPDDHYAEFPIMPFCNWSSDKQSFFDITVNAGWASQFRLLDSDLRYNVNALYGHAVHDKSFDSRYKKGAHDNWGILTLGGEYDINEISTAGLTVKGEYLRRGAKSSVSSDYDLFDEAGMITLSPTYTLRGDMYNLQLGLNGHISFSDGPAFRLSPNVRFRLALVDGFTLFANALGGKKLGYRLNSHFDNYRYDNPLLLYGSVYTPLDLEAGFKIGPFQGLSAKASIGYAIVKDQPGACYYGDLNNPYAQAYMALKTGFMTDYYVIDGRGYYLGAELNYKYRSLVEATASLKYAPQNDELYASDKHYTGYKLGIDRASMVGNFDIKVMPLRPLTLNVGLEYRGGRHALYSFMEAEDVIFSFKKMDDVINLHAGASYRINNTFTVWVNANNLLNRRYDILYGMGAQRLGVMGGINLTF